MTNGRVWNRLHRVHDTMATTGILPRPVLQPMHYLCGLLSVIFS